MKTKQLKKRYKLQTGVQQIELDTPSYNKYNNFLTQKSGEENAISGGIQALSGSNAVIGQAGNMLGNIVKNKSKDARKGAIAGGALSMAGQGAALGATIGGPWGAAIGGVGGLIAGGITAKKNYEEGERLKKIDEQETAAINEAKKFHRGTSTDVQSSLINDKNISYAKKGKYKVKTKQPRLIETEGREPIFSPKKADGTRDLLYYNPNDPTHAEGGVKAMVMPKNKYNDGTSNLMPRRSKYSLLGSGKMAVGAKQLKVNTLNDAAFSSNLTDTPSANAANKFAQPLAGINQVARNIPEDRRQEKVRTERSHKKSVKPVIVDPPTPYELKEKPPLSRVNNDYNTKNNFKKGGKYVKVYAQGSKSVSLAFSRGEKDPKGGLTQKGVDKYNRATGGNLKMAVTTPPSKLKAGSKAANRRKSFCARMSGVKGPMTKPNGEPSRKALALRKWNC